MTENWQSLDWQMECELSAARLDYDSKASFRSAYESAKRRDEAKRKRQMERGESDED